MAIDGGAGVSRPVHHLQEIRYAHAGVEHLNKIARRYAPALRDLQHLRDGVLYKVPVWLSGWSVLPDIIHDHPFPETAFM